MANSRTPKIRFKGFTDDWEQRKLGEIATEITRTNKDSNAPVMMITANYGFIEQSERYAFDNAGDSLKKYIVLQKGEMAYNHGASKLRPYGSCFALTSAENARVPFVYHCFDVGENVPEYVSLELNGKRVESQLRRIVSSGARMDGLLNISYEEYTQVLLMLPSVPEQEAVSDFIGKIEHLITLHQRKLEKLQNIKKSCLEKMFPKNGEVYPEIRFAGFTDAWEQRKLGDFGTTFTGLSGKTKDDFGHGDAKFVTYMNVFTNPVSDPDKVEAVEIDNNQNCVQYGDVFFTTSSETPEEVGMSSVWLKQTDNTYLNSFCFGYRPTEIIDPYYMAYMLRSETVRQKVIYLAQGISRYNISKNGVMQIEVPVPDLDEQRQVGALFSKLDNLITLHQRKQFLKLVKGDIFYGF